MGLGDRVIRFLHKNQVIRRNAGLRRKTDARWIFGRPTTEFDPKILQKVDVIPSKPRLHVGFDPFLIKIRFWFEKSTI